jgi:3-oxoacyl-[acyl-carrier-protein] synthase-3
MNGAMGYGSGVFVRLLAERLGTPTDLRDLDDADVRANLDTLHEQGVRRVCVTDASTAELASAVTPGAPAGPPASGAVDAVVVCTDSIGAEGPGDWSLDYRGAAGLADSQVMFVSGSACANFVPGLEAAHGLIATERADSVLVVLADRILSGTRYTAVSRSAYSDGAASFLVERRPHAKSFRLLKTATELRGLPDGTEGELAEARTTLLAMSRAAQRAMEGDPSDGIAHVVTLNLGESARRLLVMATGLPEALASDGRAAEIGHCFAADIALNLGHLERTGMLDSGDRVLALASSRYSLSAVALEYQA